jgi:Rrf2 family transcriptional regulator, iron-sulfur cluster assembly transcription factor
MLELTRKGDYAIRGMLFLARQPQNKISLISEIAADTQAPQSFLSKIFQNFTKIGLVRSARGVGGGFTLGRPADQITLFEIVEAVEGPIKPNVCVMADHACGFKDSCKVHPLWIKLRNDMTKTLSSVTLKDLA